MAPWGGHSVYPQVYRDMRHPDKFPHALGVSYGITFAVDTSMGVIGYLMFGKYVLEEVFH
jgi:vesicular inhibitory amino acid transporter